MVASQTLDTLRQRRSAAADVRIEEIEIVAAPPVSDPEPEVAVAAGAGVLSLVEMILKAPRRLDQFIRRVEIQPLLVPKLLAISLASFALFGVALAIVFSAAQVAPRLTALDEYLNEKGSGRSLVRFEATAGFAEFWTSGAALQLIAAYCFGLIAATGVCLPSLYFYGLLSGIRLSMLDVVTQALKSKATSAVALLGILPMYIALAMAVNIFDRLPTAFRDGVLWLGFILPFLAGLWGTASLFHSLGALTDTLPPERCERRGCFLRRLVVSWAACYTAVSPVMIYTVWQALQGG